MNYGLISSILRGAWAIRKDFAEAYTPFIFQLINGIDTEFENSAQSAMPFAINPVNGTHFEYEEESDEYKDITEGSVFVIPIKGTLMKADQECGPIGTETIRKHIRKAADNPKIIGGLMHTDSPGGTVDGTMLLAEDLEYFKSKKPLVDFVDGLEASAALWAGSTAEYRIASTELDEIGSIGVLMSFWDIIPYYEAQGLKYHQIVSNLSEDKTKMFDDLRKGNYEEYKKKVLDPIAKEFQNTIQRNLPKITKDQMTGDVYMARDVMGVMVDEIGNMDVAINKVVELAKQRKKSNLNKKSKNMNYKSIAVLLAVAAIELDAENTVSLTKEQLDKIEAALANAEIVAAELETNKKALADKVTEMASAVTGHDQAIIDLNAEHEEATTTLTTEHTTALQEKDDQITALGGAAGDTTPTPKSKTETGAGKGKEKSVAKGDDIVEDIASVKEEYGIN